MASTPKTAPLPSLSEMADELGQIEKEYAVAIAPLEQKLARAKVLEKALKLVCPAKPSEEWTVTGSRFVVRLSPAANERSIDYKKLLKKIPLALFGKFATCTLAALEKHVSPEIFEQVVSSDATGPRKISTSEKGQPATGATA